MTWKPACASAGMTLRQLKASSGKPCRRRIAGRSASPAMRTCMRRPLTPSTRSDRITSLKLARDDPGAGLAAQRARKVGRVGDEAHVAAAGDEVYERGDLGTHASFVELVLSEVPPRLGERHAAARVLMTLVSRIPCGLGEGTTRRQPRPASSRTVQRYFFASCLARASSMCEPIGLVGFANAGSSRSTTVCDTTHAGWRRMPR